MISQDNIGGLNRSTNEVENRDIVMTVYGSAQFLYGFFGAPYDERKIGVIDAHTFEFLKDYKVAAKENNLYDIYLEIIKSDGQKERMSPPLEDLDSKRRGQTKYLVYKK